jgi:hypothetical protein
MVVSSGIVTHWSHGTSQTRGTGMGRSMDNTTLDPSPSGTVPVTHAGYLYLCSSLAIAAYFFLHCASYNQNITEHEWRMYI